MSSLTFTLAQRPAQSVDLALLTPDRLRGKKLAEIKGLELACGNRKLAVEELFRVSSGDSHHITIHRSCDKLCGIGTGMTQGFIEVGGTVGDLLGKGMRGGTIKVRGNTGRWTGSGLHGGFIEVFGSVGDYLGAAQPGDQEGMSDGTLLVTGNAGDRIGDRMRRGVIIIKEDAGDYCGSRMLAGTIVVLGKTGKSVGLGMRRGTIIIGERPEHIAATFNSCGILKMEFLRVLFKQFSKMYRPLSMLKNYGPDAERYVGDFSLGGQGELLILQTVP